MKLPSVPDKVDRSTVVAFLESLGIDCNYVLSGTLITIGESVIQCEVLALDESGEVLVNDGIVATHRISIPVVGER